jgi:DNA (cytosine-5)-methyltransferase 1
MNEHRFHYKWTLKDAIFTKDKGKVFSCFACGGGSSMGYKLSGFDVIGCNEIDPKMMEAYITNLNPKYSFLEPIQTFKLRDDFPDELYNLDILDGSPPCSNFSMAGNRKKDWGKEKKFREGQAMQVLDTLFFDFIDLAKKLQPKVVIAENVKGLLMGDAIQYVHEIYKQFELAGYYCQHFLLDASKMGVPQRRERVFFIALRKDLSKPFLKQVSLFDILPEIKMEFNEPEILFKDVWTGKKGRHFTEKSLDYWNRTLPGYNFSEAANGSWFNHCRLSNNKVIPTLTTETAAKYHLPDFPECIDEDTIVLASSFPLDYNYMTNKISYITGMSVPPVMTAQIATEIYNQWLSKL